jgi:hypothetical protein
MSKINSCSYDEVSQPANMPFNANNSSQGKLPIFLGSSLFSVGGRDS